MKTSTILRAIGLSLLCLFSTLTAFADEASPLPDDNLISNPWFRDTSNTGGSHDGWIVEEQWGLSQKNHNPTPDDVQGTSARLGIPKATFGVDSYIYTVVEADPANTILRFQTWQVSRNLHEEKATIYASDAPDGPWVEIWQPWVETNSSVSWTQVPLLETTIEDGFPYYKIEIMCNYWQGTAGCKYTGVYFTASDESDPNAVGETFISTESTSGNGRGAAANAGSNNGNPLATDQFGLDELTATAVSDTEIMLQWPEGNDAALQFQIERSPDGRSRWEIVDTVSASDATFVDSELDADATYFYRIQVRVPGSGRLRSAVVSPDTTQVDVEPSPTATVEVIAELPTNTPEVVEVEGVVGETAVSLTSTPVPAVIAKDPAPMTNLWIG
ncbi:MAG: fibronectin type III domain-containing protein, partial [Chloroflexi bacterium]|nr:fibronectin type III domain-containing protein [Chloroflexota bacterium]